MMLPAADRIKACLDRHPDWAAARVAKSLNLRMADVEAVRGGAPAIVPPGEAPVASNGGSLISLDRVVIRYDTRTAILHVIGELPKGKLIIESELCAKTAGTDRNRFRRCLDNNAEEFQPLRIKLRLDDSSEGKFFWGHASDIAEAKRIVSL